MGKATNTTVTHTSLLYNEYPSKKKFVMITAIMHCTYWVVYNNLKLALHMAPIHRLSILYNVTGAQNYSLLNLLVL